VGQIKGLLSRTFTQKKELNNSSKPNRIKGKRPPGREKTSHMKKKELLTLALGDACRWEMLKSMMMMMMSENQSSKSQVPVTVFCSTEV
jgi:hypothetical protein